TQPPKPSLSGTPSSRINPRLAPDADSPLMVTPCVVGFEYRDDDRRKSENPETTRSASSSVSDGTARTSSPDSTVAPVFGSRQTAGRSETTTTESVIAAGDNVKSVGDALTTRRIVAKPSADTSTIAGSVTWENVNTPAELVLMSSTLPFWRTPTW